MVVTATASSFLLRIFAARAGLRENSRQHRPAAFVTTDDRLSQHAANHGAAATAPARAGPDSRAFAHLLEGFCTGLDRFQHGAFANLIAQAGGFEILDDRQLFGFSSEIVDGALSLLGRNFTISVA